MDIRCSSLGFRTDVVYQPTPIGRTPLPPVDRFCRSTAVSSTGIRCSVLPNGTRQYLVLNSQYEYRIHRQESECITYRRVPVPEVVLRIIYLYIIQQYTGI